jgi:hypothetical protein
MTTESSEAFAPRTEWHILSSSSTLQIGMRPQA